MDFDTFCALNDIDYSISYDSLGYYPRGFVFKVGDKYHFVLNGKHDIETLKKTAIHEIAHILEGHLDQSQSNLIICENEANEFIKKFNLAMSW